MLRTHSTSARVNLNAPDAGVRKTAVRAAANTYMTTTRQVPDTATIRPHAPPQVLGKLPWAGIASWRPGRAPETRPRYRLPSLRPSERESAPDPGEGFLPPGGIGLSRALLRAKIAFNSDQWSIKLSIVRESLVNVQWQLLESESLVNVSRGTT